MSDQQLNDIDMLGEHLQAISPNVSGCCNLDTHYVSNCMSHMSIVA